MDRALPRGSGDRHPSWGASLQRRARFFSFQPHVFL